MTGYSLFELTATLALLAVASTAVVPAAGAYRDRMEVFAARETMVAALQRTRSEALRTGGAMFRLDVGGELVIESGDGSTYHGLGLETGRVQVALGGGRTDTEIFFNGLGLGVFANETLEFVAGSARARLVISAHGRVRRE